LSSFLRKIKTFEEFQHEYTEEKKLVIGEIKYIIPFQILCSHKMLFSFSQISDIGIGFYHVKFAQKFPKDSSCSEGCSKQFRDPVVILKIFI